MLCSVSVPDEDVATVRTAHYKVVAPKTRLLNLEIQKTHFMFHYLILRVNVILLIHSIYSAFLKAASAT